MNIERTTGSYNDRRYGKPWIAKINFDAAGKANFDFGGWIGDPGGAGTLLISAEPGEIIAKGQKDFRKSANSAPDYYQVSAEGKLISLGDKGEAYKYHKKLQEEKKNAEATITDYCI